MITNVNGKTKIPYQNFLMNSAFAVRPLRMWKVKENRRITQKEATRLKDEVRNAVPLNLTPNISVKLHGLFSLMDSKVVTGRILIGIYVYDNKVIGIFLFPDVLDTAYQRCPLCGMTGAAMTSLETIFQLNPEALEMICLCVLHFGLRLFSFLLKLGYHQTFKV